MVTFSFIREILKKLTFFFFNTKPIKMFIKTSSNSLTLLICNKKNLIESNTKQSLSKNSMQWSEFKTKNEMKRIKKYNT